MEWSKQIRIGQSVKKGSRRLRYQISHGLVHPTVYLIACDKSRGGRLELLPSTILLQKTYPHAGIWIVGMAGYRQEALDILASMINETYQENGDCDVFRYLTERGTGAC